MNYLQYGGMESSTPHTPEDLVSRSRKRHLNFYNSKVTKTPDDIKLTVTSTPSLGMTPVKTSSSSPPEMNSPLLMTPNYKLRSSSPGSSSASSYASSYASLLSYLSPPQQESSSSSC